MKVYILVDVEAYDDSERKAYKVFKSRDKARQHADDCEELHRDYSMRMWSSGRLQSQWESEPDCPRCIEVVERELED